MAAAISPQPATFSAITVAAMPPARPHSDGVSASLIRLARARRSAIGRILLRLGLRRLGSRSTLGKMQKTCNNDTSAVAYPALQTALRSMAGTRLLVPGPRCDGRY